MVKIVEYFLEKIKPDDLINQLRLMDVGVVLDTRKTAWMPIYYKPENLRRIIEDNPIHPMRYFREHLLGNPTKNRYERVLYTKKNGETGYKRSYYPFEQVRDGYINIVLNERRVKAVFGAWVVRLKKCDDVVCLLCSCHGNEKCHTNWLKKMFEDAIIQKVVA